MTRDITTEPSPSGYWIRWAGVLQLASTHGPVLITFQGEESRFAGLRAGAAAHLLLNGHPIRGTDSDGRPNDYRSHVDDRRPLTDVMGLATSQRWVIHVSDPLLLRAHLALLGAEGVSSWSALAPELDATFGDSKLLRKRLLATQAVLSGNTKWLQRRSAKEAGILATAVPARGRRRAIAAASDDSGWFQRTYRVSTATGSDVVLAEWQFDVRSGFATLNPCGYCGGVLRARMRIPEPHGLVCLTCRKDCAGVTWPADPYNGYIASPDAWAYVPAAQVATPPGDRATPSPASRRQAKRGDRARRISALTVSQKRQIRADAKTLTIAEVVKKHGLRDHHDYYAIVPPEDRTRSVRPRHET